LAKLDLAIVAVLAAGCFVWIEQGHRVVIDAPTPSELAAAPACPGNDSVPYDENCIRFMTGSGWPARADGGASESKSVRPVEVGPPAGASPCPATDSVPYPEACLAYLQGATTLGMRWRVRAPEIPAPLGAPTPVANVSGVPANK
jgi:hypothetical protein